ncbi:MAG: hypothetical protein EXR59_01820 [Dehalococcoidia bacterium]|nr:hypothetical protein [Dehalococcoidia bacterium]
MTTENHNSHKNGKSMEEAESQWLNVELGPAVANRQARQTAKTSAPAKRPRWYMEGVSEEEVTSQSRMSRQATAIGGLLLAALGILVLMVVIMIIITFVSLFT